MKRMHLIELEDQSWFPRMIRDSMTDHLSFLASRAGALYKTFAVKLAAAMKKTGDRTLVELCAGGGGPSLALSKQIAAPLGHRPHVILTDLFPNLARMEMVRVEGAGAVSYIKTPVNACNVGAEPDGFRLCFNSFHHLRPEIAIACLSDAVTHRQGIAVMELVDRSFYGFIQVIFAGFTVFLAAPFCRPFKWSRLFFTYIVPVIPLAVLFDGFVSCLRVYSPSELQDLVSQLPANDYHWEFGTAREPFSPTRITYLVGVPPA